MWPLIRIVIRNSSQQEMMCLFFGGWIIYPNPKPICLCFWGSQNQSECKFGWRWRRVQTIPDSSYDPSIIVSNKGLKNAPLFRVRFGESIGLETRNPLFLLFNSQKRDPIFARNRFCQFLPPNRIGKTWHSSMVDMYKKKLLPVSQLPGLPKYRLKIFFFKAIFSKTAFRVFRHVMECLRVTSWLTYMLFWFGGFLKWWYPTTMGFPTKNDHFGVFWGYHHLRKHLFIVIFFQIETIQPVPVRFTSAPSARPKNTMTIWIWMMGSQRDRTNRLDPVSG